MGTKVFRATRWLGLVFVCALLLSSLKPAVTYAADDWDITGGHFYTQASGEPGSGKGFAITDEGDIAFWSEFKRLGGVSVLGYPASQRFEWDGFTVQATQRVVMQWRPEIGQVYFANVFDRLHDLGKDDWLLAVRQVPKIADWSSDAGKSWDAVVANHLQLLDANPAIKAKYYEAVGDPIQMNGLPMAPIADMGNVYVLRAQRVVIQQWKEDLPWAKKGDVTVALGGDFTKEADVVPVAARTPSLPGQASSSTPAAPAPAASTPAPAPAATDRQAMADLANQVWPIWMDIVLADDALYKDLKAAGNDWNRQTGAIDKAVKRVEPLVPRVNALEAPNVPYAPALVEQMKKAVPTYYEALKQINWGLVSKNGTIVNAALNDLDAAYKAIEQSFWEFKAGIEKQGLTYKDGQWQ